MRSSSASRRRPPSCASSRPRTPQAVEKDRQAEPASRGQGAQAAAAGRPRRRGRGRAGAARARAARARATGVAPTPCSPRRTRTSRTPLRELERQLDADDERVEAAIGEALRALDERAQVAREAGWIGQAMWESSIVPFDARTRAVASTPVAAELRQTIARLRHEREERGATASRAPGRARNELQPGPVAETVGWPAARRAPRKRPSGSCASGSSARRRVTEPSRSSRSRSTRRWTRDALDRAAAPSRPRRRPRARPRRAVHAPHGRAGRGRAPRRGARAAGRVRAPGRADARGARRPAARRRPRAARPSAPAPAPRAHPVADPRAPAGYRSRLRSVLAAGPRTRPSEHADGDGERTTTRGRRRSSPASSRGSAPWRNAAAASSGRSG